MAELPVLLNYARAVAVELVERRSSDGGGLATLALDQSIKRQLGHRLGSLKAA
jgi:hypothetical protein